MCKPPTHFCYICGQILNNDNPLSHFSNKESKCYNKLWDDESKNTNNIDTNNSSINDNNNEEDKRDDSDDNDNDNDNDNNNGNYRNDRNRINSYRNRIGRNFISRSHNDDLNMTNIMLKNVINNNSYRSEY
jgi:hypothetical protein